MRGKNERQVKTAIMSNTVNLLALGMLLVDRGVFTQEEFIEAAEEAKKIIEKEMEDAG